MADFPECVENIVSALSGCREFSWEVAESQVLRRGLVSGTLLGGNLTCLCQLLGTPYFPDLKRALLLLEDRGEALYRLDRLLTHLKLAGVLDQVGGLILGHFHECDDPGKVRDLVMEQTRGYSFPVVADLPFGHGSPNEVIPLGCSFLLDTFEGSLRVISDFGFQISDG
jgi:muramoyltetrapeptide carboxypeptidase